MSNIVLVEVSSGVAEFTRVPSDAEAYLVNWDNPESGNCAFCGGPLKCDGTDMHYPCRSKYLSLAETTTLEIKAADRRCVEELALKLEKLASAAETLTDLVKADKERSAIETVLAGMLVGLVQDA